MILTVVTANQGQTYIKGENNKVKWVGKFFKKWKLIRVRLGTVEKIEDICMKFSNH